MKKQIFIETGGSDETNECVFVKTLCKKLKIEEFEIIRVGGWENLDNREQYLKEEECQNIILFDADNDINDRRKRIGKILENHKAKATIFLFPNNKDKGCFETLLEKIAVDKKPINCFDAFTNCLGDNYITPNLKAKMYSYITVLKGSKNITNGGWEFKNTKYWDLDCDDIQPLKDCLNNIEEE